MVLSFASVIDGVELKHTEAEFVRPRDDTQPLTQHILKLLIFALLFLIKDSSAN